MREIYFIFCVLDLCICVVYWVLCLDIFVWWTCIFVLSGHVFIFMLCFYKNVLSFYDMSTFGMDMSIVDEYCYLSFVLCIYA